MSTQEQEAPLSKQPARSLIEVRSVSYTAEEVGRGIFALADLPRGTLVENAHAVRIPKDQYREHLRHTVLEDYVYTAPERNGDMLLVLGLGSLFNHSRSPNVDRRIVSGNNELRVEYFAARTIAAGEELTIFYGDHVPWEAEERAARRAELLKEQGEANALPQDAEDLFA